MTTSLSAFQIALLLVLAPACVAAAWFDLWRRRIPNILCGVAVLAGLAAALVFAGGAALGSHALHGGIALVVGMVLFRLGVIGGGDAKFYAACAAWFPLAQGLRLLLSVSVAGLLLFIAWFIVRRLMRKPIRTRASDDPFDSLPYGIAIAGGALITAWISA